MIRTALNQIPAWAWTVIFAMAAIEPLSHVWMMYFPPEGTVFTGLHSADSVIFIHAMRMFDSGFFAPYVSGASELGDHSFRYFPIPFMWMYGAVGSLGRILHIPEFLTLGIANGIGTALLLTAVFLFFNALMPRHAPTAFLLFAMSGGPGGLFYWVSWVVGWTSHPDFEAYIFRYAQYQLLEGSNMPPWLLGLRLYYTVPLAFCLLAITMLLHSMKTGSKNAFIASLLLLLPGVVLNIRLGPMTWGVTVLLLYVHPSVPLRTRLNLGAGITAVVAIALAITLGMLRWNPAFGETTASLVRQSLWFSSFISAALFHLILIIPLIWRSRDHLPHGGRVALYAALGYLGCFTLFFILHQLYHGNFLITSDASAAVRVSDFALIGAVVGIGWAWRRKPPPQKNSDEDAILFWLILWFTSFLALSISAFGQGWFIEFAPERIAVFMGPPLCLLSAYALSRLKPVTARILCATMVACGVLSISAASLFIQGPLGHTTPGQGPFVGYHAAFMTESDAAVLDEMGDGMVLTPATRPFFGDVVTVRGNNAVHGMGSRGLSDKPALRIVKAVQTFFGESTSEEERHNIINEWSVDWVFCPDSTPVPEKTIAQLRAMPDLIEIAAHDNAVLFQVKQ